MTTSDPGEEFWRRQAAQLEVINAIQALIDREPDRFAGLTAKGSGRITLHVVDPAVRQDPRLVSLLDDARAVEIETAITDGPRSLRELKAIMDEIMRDDLLRKPGIRAAEFGMDPATATVRVVVADSALDTARRALAHFGEAVAVTGNGPPDLSMRLNHYSESRDGWPVPTLAPERAAGRPAAEVAELYRREGFEVETYHLGDPFGLTADLRPTRIRLLVHDGRVVDAGQA